MGKQKVLICRRHKQTPKALISPTDHVASDEKEDIEDTVCLWILLLFSTFLAPRSAYVCSPQMIKYLDDIERIGSYARVVAFHELILHNIEEARKMVKMNAKRGRHDEKPRKNQFIFGCSYALCVESKLPIHPSEQWVLEGQKGKTNSGDFARAEEASTPAVSINAQMAALVDALKAAEESRKAENEDFRQKLESLMTQVEGFAKSAISLRQEKEKPTDVPPSDPPCEAAEKKDFEEEMIDCAVQLLEEGCSLSDYKKWEYLPTLIVSSIHTGKRASISQKSQRLFECFPAATDLDHLGKLDFLFFVLHTTNHWHLLVVDLKNKCFISYNSIKGNKSYDAAVRNWVFKGQSKVRLLPLGRLRSRKMKNPSLHPLKKKATTSVSRSRKRHCLRHVHVKASRRHLCRITRYAFSFIFPFQGSQPSI
ncbi:hypothetical protein Taro_009976 [Colocasia esculenta]|uniref:Ubiquitin-like protease family profile domain-containing protein n=1 Tax=Colocasia esculenta TaxID=4460 RepID=A0A843U6G7_COLES|nr:hypothetical protein [Colocasia esculenta]